MRIYLLRHGQTDWNKEWRLQGHCDIPLNQNGIEQVKATCAKLGSLGGQIDVMIASPLGRARTSAELAAEALGYPKDKILLDPDLIERGFGEAEGTTKEERMERFREEKIPGMESEEDVCRRAERVLTRCREQYPGKTILLATHGAFLKALMAVAIGTSYSDRAVPIVNPGSLHLLEDKDGKFSLSFNVFS